MLKSLLDFIRQPLSLGAVDLGVSPLDIIVQLLLFYRLTLLLIRRFILKPLAASPQVKRRLVAGQSSVSVVTVVLSIPIFYLASRAAKAASGFVRANVLTRLQLTQELRFSIGSLVNYIILGIMILIGLSVIGINLSSLAVLFGVLGIGIGFGMQGIVANFVARIVIILERPIIEGDRIHSKVHNYSHQDPSSLLVNLVSVSYDTDLDQARDVLLAAAGGNPHLDSRRSAAVRVVEFGDSGILLELWTPIRDAKQRREAHSWTNLEIWRRFRQSAIIFPFPQRDVNLRTTVKSTGEPTRSAGALTI